MSEEPTSIQAKIWQDAGALLKPELREFMILSGADIADLTIMALRSENSAEKLAETLNQRAQQKKDLQDAYKVERMMEDAAKIQDVGSWPHIDHLPLKRQPWVTSGAQRFGRITRGNVDIKSFVVTVYDGKTEHFDTIEDLVKVWSVD